VNNRNIKYALTVEGGHEIGRRSFGYFKRTIKNVVVYKDAVSEVIGQAKTEGYSGVELEGVSDLAFIVEHECYKQSVEFRTVETACDSESMDWFRVIAETVECEPRPGLPDSGCFELKSLISVRK